MKSKIISLSSMILVFVCAIFVLTGCFGGRSNAPTHIISDFDNVVKIELYKVGGGSITIPYETEEDLNWFYNKYGNKVVEKFNHRALDTYTYTNEFWLKVYMKDESTYSINILAVRNWGNAVVGTRMTITFEDKRYKAEFDENCYKYFKGRFS